MKLSNRLKGNTQIYFAGQWAEAGVYRCLDLCPLEQGLGNWSGLDEKGQAEAQVV